MSEPAPIYLDHHATTPVLPAVVETMRPFLAESFGNASSSHAFGRRARQALEDARDRIAARLSAQPDEVIFTSGATESNNLAIFGLAGDPPGHILTSPIEHPCVVEPLQQLAKRGFSVEQLGVGRDGVVTLDELADRVRPDTRLIALMRVNHETGAIQPPVPIGSYLWHCDAAQAAGKLPVRFRELGAASLAFSGHKLGAPPGIGALIVRRNVNLRPMFFGGHQQQSRRPGTEPVALAVALSTALDIACEIVSATKSRVSELRSQLLRRLRETCAPVVVNGPEDAERQSPFVLNISFPGVRADSLLAALDLAGVACSTGSACSSGSLLPSPVLKAMSVSDDVLRSAMRFSFAGGTTADEIDEAAKRIGDCVSRMRS